MCVLKKRGDGDPLAVQSPHQLCGAVGALSLWPAVYHLLECRQIEMSEV